MHEKMKGFLSTSKLYLAQISVWSEQEMEFSIILYTDLETQLGKQEHLDSSYCNSMLRKQSQKKQVVSSFLICKTLPWQGDINYLSK